MNSRIIRLGALACLFLLQSTAQAQQAGGISWTYLELGYLNTDLDSSAGDVEGDGALFGGSIAVNDWIHAFAEYQTSSLDDIQIDDGMGNITTVSPGDFDAFGIGIGIHSPLSSGTGRGYRSMKDRFAWFFDAEWLTGETDIDDRDGWAIDGGFRAVNFSRVEFIASVGYEKIERVDGEMTLGGRVLFNLIPNLQLQAGIDWNDNNTQWLLGGRYNFGNFQIFD